MGYLHNVLIFQDDLETRYKELEKEHENVKKVSKSLDDKNKSLESELRDARDNADLLEFRLLELEQRDSRERSPEMLRKLEDKRTEEMGSVSGTDSGRTGSLISLDDILETQTDFRVRFIQLYNCILECHCAAVDNAKSINKQPLN